MALRFSECPCTAETLRCYPEPSKCQHPVALGDGWPSLDQGLEAVLQLCCSSPCPGQVLSLEEHHGWTKGAETVQRIMESQNGLGRK